MGPDHRWHPRSSMNTSSVQSLLDARAFLYDLVKIYSTQK